MSEQMQPQKSKFKLSAPEEVIEKVNPATVSEDVAQAGLKILSEDQKKDLSKQADMNVDQILSAAPQSEIMNAFTDFVKTLGSEPLRKTANSNSFMQMSTKAMKQMESGTDVANALVDLRKIVEELDPSQRENIFSPKSFLKNIPILNKLTNKVDNYFKEYQANETHINAIIEALHGGKQSLIRDNAAIKLERSEMWDNMADLEQYIFQCSVLSKKIEEAIPTIELQDPYKAKVIKEDILFYLKQREIDLRTNMAVQVQAYLSLDIVRKNNEELIKGVDRANDTTIAALRVAVMVASALGRQQLVLNQIKTVNKVTETLITNNSKMLAQTGVEIHKQAAAATISPEVLANAFKEIVTSLDSIDKFKAEALVSMGKTIDNLDSSVSDMKKYMSEKREAAIQDVKLDNEPARTESGALRMGPK